MAKSIKGPVPEVTITLDPMPDLGKSPAKERIEVVGREILERLFPHDFGNSGQARGKVTFIRKEGTTTFFELSALFLYRQTYTAVTHKVIFALSGDEYSIISVDAEK